MICLTLSATRADWTRAKAYLGPLKIEVQYAMNATDHSMALQLGPSPGHSIASVGRAAESSIDESGYGSRQREDAVSKRFRRRIDGHTVEPTRPPVVLRGVTLLHGYSAAVQYAHVCDACCIPHQEPVYAPCRSSSVRYERVRFSRFRTRVFVCLPREGATPMRLSRIYCGHLLAHFLYAWYLRPPRSMSCLICSVRCVWICAGNSARVNFVSRKHQL